MINTIQKSLLGPNDLGIKLGNVPGKSKLFRKLTNL